MRCAWRSLPGVSAEELNNRAWLLATQPNATPEALAVALILAERAVEETERRDPTILDTLAEVQFQLGHPERALVIIDEAIARRARRGLLPRAAAPLPRRARPRRPARSAASRCALGRAARAGDRAGSGDGGITV